MSRESASTNGMTFAKLWESWVYEPATIWQDAFRDFMHPEIFLGCNIQDKDDELHVLDEVGSYGKQISKILKAVDVCIKHLPKKDLDPVDQVALQEFTAYEGSVNAALAERRGPLPSDLGSGYVERLRNALERTQRIDTKEYEQIMILLKDLVDDYEQAQKRQLARNATVAGVTGGDSTSETPNPHQ